MFKEYQIAQIGEVVGGGTPSTKNDEYWDGDIPWIAPSDLTGYSSVYISRGENNITKSGLNNSGAKLLPKNTVLFSSRAPIGYVAIAENPLCTNQGFKSIICDESIVDPLYLYYYIKANLDYFKLWGSGATFPEISGNAMKRIKIRIMDDIKKQKEISSLLYCYDNLIEVNNKRIKVLEQMAENLYKEWFVRFRFPGYENAEFENGIPKGWEEHYLENVMSFIRGVSYSSSEIVDGDIALLSMNNIRPYGGYIADYSRVYSGKYKNEQIVRENDLIMSITDMTQDRRIIGYVGLVSPTKNKCVICTHLMKLSSHIYHNYFLYGLFTFSGLSRYISEYATGANVLGLTANILNRIKWRIPNKELADVYALQVTPLFKEMHFLEIQNNNLIKQRDLLLPRLMSGKLEV